MSDVSGKLFTILDPYRCPLDLTYFTFRSIVVAATVDIRALSSFLSLKFSLWSPQALSTSTSNSAVVTKTPADPVLVTTLPNPI